MTRKREEMVRDGGNVAGICTVQVADLREIQWQVGRLREVVRRYGMRKDCAVVVSQVARELELMVMAYLMPRIPGIEG